MERSRHTSSKSASSFEGPYQSQKHRAVGELHSDSSSCINAGNRKDDTLVEIGQSSVGRATNMPLANVLADRICRESEPKRTRKETKPKKRSISDIARLIRREGLPFLWHAYKQKKKLQGSYQLKNASTNAEANRKLYDGQSSRTPEKQQEINDVYEDLETSPFVNGRYSSKWSPSSMLTKYDLALIRRNLDAKRLTLDESVSEKLHESEELVDTSDTVDSRDISMQFGRKKKSLFRNVVYDQQCTSSSLLGSPTALLKLPNAARRLNRDMTGNHKVTCHLNINGNLLLDTHNYHRAHNAKRISDIQLKEKDKKNIPTTPIVVLKPNLGDMQNGQGLSPYYFQDYSPNSRKVRGCPSVGSGREMTWRKTESYYDAEFLKPGCQEARKLANRVTRRLIDAFDESVDSIYFGFTGHVIDESLDDTKESDLDRELETRKWLSRSSFNEDNKRVHASSGSVIEEAKIRLAERWKITDKYKDLKIVGNDSTLGEMLSTPGKEKRSKKTAYRPIDSSSKQVGIDNGSYMLHGLLGTSNMDDSKNKTERTSRSRSGSTIGGRIHARGNHDMLANETLLQHSETTGHGTSKVIKQHPSHKDHFSSQGSCFRGKKHLPCPPIYIEELESSLEARFETQMEANVKDIPYRQLTFQMEEKDACNRSDASEIVSAEDGTTTLLSRIYLSHPDNESSSSNVHDQKDFCLQGLHEGSSEEGSSSLKYLGSKPISLENTKAGDYTSPVTVHEVLSVKDALSSSESFERVGAELNELRMQLQLLKMESGTFDDESTQILVDKDTVDSSSRGEAEGWEASYTLDLLISAGLHEFGFDLFRIMWHSPDCPLDPRLFDNLEEKYRDEMACSRADRMLLFDTINSLSEIFQKHVDLSPWVMPKLAGSIHLTWQKRRGRYIVEKLICQESSNGLQAVERILDREMQWSDSNEEIALTGNDMEKLLFDDLLKEFLLEYWW